MQRNSSIIKKILRKSNLNKVLSGTYSTQKIQETIKVSIPEAITLKTTTSGRVKIPKTPNEEVSVIDGITPGYLARVVGSSHKKWNKVLEHHPVLYNVKKQDFLNSAEYLKSLSFTVDDLLSKPLILYSNAITLENRYKVLKECGFTDITIGTLNKYLTVMNKTVTLLKSHGLIPYATNIPEILRKCFTDIEVEIPQNLQCHEDLELKVIRQNILNCYLVQKLGLTNEDLDKIWKVYYRIRHRSFKYIQEMIQILMDDLNFPIERIIKNSYLLHGEPENVKRILKEIPKIGNENMRDIVYRRPKILMSTCNSLLKTIEHVKAFGINEDAILKCLEVLTLGSDTVLERLHDLNEIEEFQVLGTNPRVLRLVHYQNKARQRLEYLNQLKVRCASLHILSCGSQAFAKFARDGSDKTKGRDIVVYLGNVMNENENEIRHMLSRHPNWCHIPSIQVKQCYDFLRSKKFSNDDIFQNIHLLLYPIKRIEEKLYEIYSKGTVNNIRVEELLNNQILTLILYYIEFDFHFTGDGIWTEQHSHHVENFNNLLPDFPASLNKVYKYGMKPGGRNNSITQKLFMNS